MCRASRASISLLAFMLLEQVLLNTAMSPEAAEALETGGAPTHIHGMNLMRLRQAHGQAMRGSPQLQVLQEKLFAQYCKA